MGGVFCCFTYIVPNLSKSNLEAGQSNHGNLPVREIHNLFHRVKKQQAGEDVFGLYIGICMYNMYIYNIIIVIYSNITI